MGLQGRSSVEARRGYADAVRFPFFSQGLINDRGYESDWNAGYKDAELARLVHKFISPLVA